MTDETRAHAIAGADAQVARGAGVGATGADAETTRSTGTGERDTEATPREHAATSHAGQAEHHHHSHASDSHHPGGHHLLQVEHLSVGFRMYEEGAGASSSTSDAARSESGAASDAGAETGRPLASSTRSRGGRQGGHGFLAAQQREVQVISDLSISVHAGEIIAVVGASGSGKTLLADAIMGLFEPNSIVAGRIWFDGEELDAEGLRSLRGRGISLVPQSVANLDPLMKVGKQVEGFAGGRRERAGRAGCAPLSKAQRRERRRELFARYGLGEEVAELYPFELSGGMARRVLLCCALMDDPWLIIADEPTPGLDLDLALAALADLRAFANAGGGVMLITHDIELALRVADRVAVFRDGTVIEETDVASFGRPETLRHPFTRALWHALPEHDFAPETPMASAPTGTSAGETPAPEGPKAPAAGTSASEAPAPHDNGGSPC